MTATPPPSGPPSGPEDPASVRDSLMTQVSNGSWSKNPKLAWITKPPALAAFAGLAVLAVVALGISIFGMGGPRVDAKDPWASLHPWDHKWSNIKRTENGVEYILITEGPKDGVHPSPVDDVEVRYDGRFADDKEQFDSTQGDETVTFKLNQVIPGWTEGLQKLKPGDQAMFWIPAEQAYGRRPPPGMRRNADLMFLVTLKAVHAAKAPDAMAWKKALPWPTDSAEVQRTASGLEYFVIKPAPAGADAAPVEEQDYAVLQFEGRLDDGTTFDSSYQNGQPAYFPVGDLIPGFSEALKLMREGDHWMIRMPPHLAYGEENNGRIPPNSALTFEIDLERVVHLPKPEADPNAKPAPAPKPTPTAKPTAKTPDGKIKLKGADN